MVFSPIDVLLATSILQSLALATFLLLPENIRVASNQLLVATLVSFAFGQGEILAYGTGLTMRHPGLAYAGTLVGLLQAGTLYLYAQSLMFREFRLRPAHLVHTTLFWVVAAILVVEYYRQPTAVQLQILQRQDLPRHADLAGAGGGDPRRGAGVSVGDDPRALAVRSRPPRCVLQHRKPAAVVAALAADRLFGGMGGQPALLPVGACGQESGQLALDRGDRWRRRFRLHQLSAPQRATAAVAVQRAQRRGRPRYCRRSRPTRRHATTGYQDPALEARLQRHMLQARPHLHSNLTVAQLARELAVSPRELSRLLNQGLGTNFFEFISNHRLEEAKTRLSHPTATDSILTVMYESGFNSKSVFNTLFRKSTGMTPSQYRTQHLRASGEP